MYINYYGFFIVLGVLAGTLVAEKLNKKYHISNIQYPIADILPWILVPGIIGARLYHVFDYWGYYSENLIKIFFVWQGGLGIWGGIMGGIIGLFVYSFWWVLRSPAEILISPSESNSRLISKLSIGGVGARIVKAHKIWQAPRALLKFVLTKFFMLLDLIAIGLPLGQAIGRWGNYFNQELYGLPTNFPWGIFIRPENRLAGYEGFSYFHPVFLYESVGCLVIFTILIRVFLNRFGGNTDFYSVSKLALTALVIRVWRRLKNIRINCQYGTQPPSSNRAYARKNCVLPNALGNISWFHRKNSGTIFFTYLFLYSFLRFFLEYLRIDPWRWGILTAAQWLSLGFGAVSLIALLKQLKIFQKV